MIIREYIDSDWLQIGEVHDLARSDELKAASLSEAFLPLKVAAKREGLFDYRVLVAVDSDNVLGFIAHDLQEIAWLYVHPAHHRKGIGKALLGKVTTSIPRPFTAEVLQDNNNAIQFYQSCGFRAFAIKSGVMPGNEKYSESVCELNNFKYA